MFFVVSFCCCYCVSYVPVCVCFFFDFLIHVKIVVNLSFTLYEWDGCSNIVTVTCLTTCTFNWKNKIYFFCLRWDEMHNNIIIDEMRCEWCESLSDAMTMICSNNAELRTHNSQTYTQLSNVLYIQYTQVKTSTWSIEEPSEAYSYRVKETETQLIMPLVTLAYLSCNTIQNTKSSFEM